MANENSKPASLVPPKMVTKMSELPPGKTITVSAKQLDFDAVAKMQNPYALYAPNALNATGDHKAEISIWVIVSEQFMSQTHLKMELRKKLHKLSYLVVSFVVSDPDIVKILNDNAAQEVSLETDQKNGEEAKENDIEIYFDNMVSYALKEKVSDIHIEKRSTRSQIRMRKHGQLIEYDEISNMFADRLCRGTYNAVAENKEVAFNEEKYQAASVNMVVMGSEVKLRYQSLPVYPGGFDVILRVLPLGNDEEKIQPLGDLGYSASQVEMLLDVSTRPVGAVIIAGTTGSGKSTTLKNLIMYINNARHYRCKIYTIEDPPEYKIPRVSQIPVIRHDDKASVSTSPFLAPLKATMRGDPDILMIGEIRDDQTGDGLKKATQSGHQVLTTVHATSALGIIERLTDFGITPSVMGSPDFISGLIYQKLVPQLCPHCSIEFKTILSSSRVSEGDLKLAKRMEQVASVDEDDIRIQGKGCDKCKNLGIIGRTVCSEIIAPDVEMFDLFRDQKTVEAKYYWRSLSNRDRDSDDMKGKTVLEHALLKMRRGMISPYDVEELFGPVNKDKILWEQMEDKRKRQNNK